MYLMEDAGNIILLVPIWIMRLELGQITDIPDVITDPVILAIFRIHGLACQLLTNPDGLLHGAITESPTANIIDFA